MRQDVVVATLSPSAVLRHDAVQSKQVHFLKVRPSSYVFPEPIQDPRSPITDVRQSVEDFDQ